MPRDDKPWIGRWDSGEKEFTVKKIAHAVLVIALSFGVCLMSGCGEKKKCTKCTPQKTCASCTPQKTAK